MVNSFSYSQAPHSWQGTLKNAHVGATTDPLYFHQDRFSHFRICHVHQVHGHYIWEDPGKIPVHVQADGMVSTQPQTLLWIQTADCVPIHATDGKCIAMVHAGWRGIHAGIVSELMRHLDPKELQIVLGPAICQKHYEVGPDVISNWQPADTRLSQALLTTSDKRHYLDLKLLITHILKGHGVPEDAIHSVPICTYENTGFPSYRRDKGATQRLYSYIFRH